MKSSTNPCTDNVNGVALRLCGTQILRVGDFGRSSLGFRMERKESK